MTSAYSRHLIDQSDSTISKVDARFITKHSKACPQMASTTVSLWHGCYTQVHTRTHTHPTTGKSLSASMQHDKPAHTTTSCAKWQYNIRLQCSGQQMLLLNGVYTANK